MTKRRFFAAAFVAAAFVVTTGAPAMATLKESGIVCNGSAVITATEDNHKYKVDARQAKVTLPYAGEAAWQGSVSPPTHNHSGQVWVDAGFTDVVMGKWSSKNEKSQSSKKGTKDYNIPSWVPPFQLAIGGFHSGKEGSCTGTITLILDESWYKSPAAVAITVGLVIGLALFGTAGVPRGGR